MLDIIIYTVCIIGLLIATITDIKTREVPDWLNFSLIAAGIGINLLFTIALKDYRLIINSVAGFLAFFIIAWIMFYTGQWGGGDSKILMGLGALIGLDLSFRNNMLLDFLINALIIGAVYGLLWSIILTFRKWKDVTKEIKKISKSRKMVASKKVLIVVLLVLAALALTNKNPAMKFFLISFMILALVTFYLWIYIKAIEKSAMLKYVTPDKLTEGDWIAKDIVVDKKRITGPRDLGVSKAQIKKLTALYKKRKIKKILIKEGIPFVPSFLAAFIITITLGNILILILTSLT